MIVETTVSQLSQLASGGSGNRCRRFGKDGDVHKAVALANMLAWL